MKTKRFPDAKSPALQAGDRSAHKVKERGAALILTLIVVSMLTILVLAYLFTMRTERQAAHAYANTQRAKMVAQGAVSHGIAILRTNIPDPALISETAGNAPGENWAVNPGRLTTFDDSGNVNHIPLHSGEVLVSPNLTADPDVHSADLNEPLPGSSMPMIAAGVDSAGNPSLNSDPPPMRVRWVPVLKDPSKTASKDNPITGRYAFWMDDESSKINFNTALGKPARGDNDPQGFWEQYDIGLLTPLFTQGAGDVEYNARSRDREWALGKLRSVNLDVLFDDAGQLDHNALLGHAWLRGFSRYPEAILDFVRLEENKRREWYHRQKYNLTFYSRAPEFNAFGRSRLFTTNIPLSLEAGPLYQLPFVYNGPEADETDYQIEGILHLHSLMGSLGFTHNIGDGKDLGNVHAANIVNRAQFEMLKRYMSRRWPGYENTSFIDKYGERECYQMALSMLTKARMATTTMASGGRTASRDWAWRTTSVIYSPHRKERAGATPERHYWQVPISSGTGSVNANEVPMLPQMPGPHITEVRLFFKPQRVGRNPFRYRINYRYEVEYYMNGHGPVLYLNDFPAKVDFFEVTATQEGEQTARQQFGPPEPTDDAAKRGDRNWNYRYSLGLLQARAGRRVRIGSATSGHPNRRVLSSPTRTIGKSLRLPPEKSSDSRRVRARLSRDPVNFNALGGKRDVTLNVKWRLGMGVRPDNRRPRQMIPLGETSLDTLQAQVEIDLRSGEQQVISWQINDPRLSWHPDSWLIDMEDGGTPGARNMYQGDDLEPEESSTEKSKFRYFMRGPGRVRDPENPDGRRFSLNRPDEYNSRSRITSKGYWSVLHTGIQNLVPWRTLDLGGAEAGGPPIPSSPPDYLLLDLIGSTYPMQHDQWRINSTLPDEFSTVSFMNSTAGQVNLNSKIYPADNPYFQAPPRRKPLQAVFEHLRSEEQIGTLLDGIDTHQQTDFFRYVGELSEVHGYRRPDADATEFENEELLRNMIGCLTTKSNTFGMWGAAQVVKKSRENTNFGSFEDNDQVLGEKRFFAIIERYVWPGKDGLPGNAHVDSRGEWDRIAVQREDTRQWSGATTDTLYQLPGSPPMRKGGRANQYRRLRLDLNGTYPRYDGPQEVEMDRYASRTLGKVVWDHSTLEDAYNPPQPVIKYRVVYFKYLDE